MTAEQATALLVALTGLIGAIAAVIVQIRGLRKDLNGRVTELLVESTAAAHRHGELEGRDFMRRLLTGATASATDVEGVPPGKE